MGREAGEAGPGRDQEHRGAGWAEHCLYKIKSRCINPKALAEYWQNSYKHLQYWVGLYLQEDLPDMGGGDLAEHTLTYYFQHLKEIFLESHVAETIDAQHLHKISAKEISQDFSCSFPPPEVI